MENLKQQTLKTILLLIVAWFIAHYIEFFSHEYAHSFVAWVAAFKQNTFDIVYGHPTLMNIIFNQQVDEKVNYANILLAGHRHLIALAAFAGLASNLLWYIITQQLMKVKIIQSKHFIFMVILMLNMIAILNFISYIPCRTFATHADVANFAFGLNIAPAWVSCLTIPIAVSIYVFFSRTIPHAIQVLNLNYYENVFLLFASVATTLFIPGQAGINNYGILSHYISVSIMFVISPLMLILYWLKLNNNLHK